MINSPFVLKKFMHHPIEGIQASHKANTIGTPHQHTWCQLQYAIKGTMNIIASDQSFVIPPQRAVWLPKHVEHQVNNLSEVDYRSLHISDELGQQLGNKVKVIEVSDFLRELIIRGCEAWQAQYPLNDINKAMMTLLIAEIQQAPVSPLHLPWPKDPRLKKICQILQHNPADNRTLPELAQLSGASVRTLNRLFINECQLGFSDWRQKLRVLIGLERLQTNTSITQVALELGYSSSSVFINVFKKHLHASPKSYLKRQ
ncbi:AraC family transcriptional regulator [Shewanella surugensis]|uniref:Helix-turn-helix transcriptional regulator n=1 Tax=Shewanella surugensis TaxID=212020 RepID=A0ABT0LDV4_9GAMM|nr:helix-turn-helix transcriptional regulator [Shewanella surugensis]MCL1125882.1 helix-turn-helix transcriptional regulator [Shewanella surugensis]